MKQRLLELIGEYINNEKEKENFIKDIDELIFVWDENLLDILQNKHKNLFELLDNYNGKFAIISVNPKIINWFNKNRPEYVVGEVITKRKGFNLSFYFNNSLSISRLYTILVVFYISPCFHYTYVKRN